MTNSSPKTIISALSAIPTESNLDKVLFAGSEFIPKATQLISEKTAIRIEEAVRLVPEAQACVTSGRCFDTEIMVNQLRDRGIDIWGYEYPWATSEEQKNQKQQSLIQEGRGKTSAALQAMAEYLVHVAPEKQGQIIQESTTVLPVGFNLKLDALQFTPALESTTIKNLNLIADALPGVELQVMMEPHIAAFPTLESWFQYIQEFNQKNIGRFKIMYSMDMPNLDRYKSEGTSLTLLDDLIARGGLKVEQIGAIELSGYSNENGKNHDMPWNTPFSTKDLFLLLQKEGMKSLPIVLETDPRRFRDLVNGLPSEYVKVLEQVFN